MTLLILASVSLVMWFLSLLAGGGSPLVLIPLVQSLFGAEAVPPVITLGMLVGNGHRSVMFWRQINGPTTLWYLPGAIAGALIGSYGLSRLHFDQLQVIIAIALVLMALNHWLGAWLASHWPQKHLFPWTLPSLSVQPWYFLPTAFLNAIASSLIGSTGPIMNPLYLSYGLVKEDMIATKAFHKTVLHLVKLIAYGSFGMLTAPDLGHGLVIGLASLPANWLGRQVLQRMSVDTFRQWVFGFIAVSGLWMAIQAF